MTNKELADLIFPDAKEIKYYEEKYKIRMEGIDKFTSKTLKN